MHTHTHTRSLPFFLYFSSCGEAPQVQINIAQVLQCSPVSIASTMLICLPFFLEVGRLSQGAWGTKGRTVFARRDWCCVLCALLLPGSTQVNRHVPSVRFFGGGFLSHPTDMKRYSFSEKKLAFYSCVLALPLLSCASFLRLELWCSSCVVWRLAGERSLEQLKPAKTSAGLSIINYQKS